MPKMLSFWVFATLAAAASTQTPSAYDAGVPTGIPVPGNYSGPFRPQIHFSPPKNFVNDPNGCFRDANGTWHLYYQCKSNQAAVANLC